MTRMTQQMILSIATTIFSLGFLGWIMWKVGILDVIFTLVVNFVVLFPILAISLGILNPDTYNMYVDSLNKTIESINDAFKKGVSPVAVQEPLSKVDQMKKDLTEATNKVNAQFKK